MDDAGYGSMTKIIDKLQNNENSSYWENKAIMNQELDEFYRLTKKRIYFKNETNIDEKSRKSC